MRCEFGHGKVKIRFASYQNGWNDDKQPGQEISRGADAEDGRH